MPQGRADVSPALPHAVAGGEQHAHVARGRRLRRRGRQQLALRLPLQLRHRERQRGDERVICCAVRHLVLELPLSVFYTNPHRLCQILERF